MNIGETPGGRLEHEDARRHLPGKTPIRSGDNDGHTACAGDCVNVTAESSRFVRRQAGARVFQQKHGRIER
jgi:hypothetical protein